MIRWGIIGVGDVTEVKSGPGFQRARGSALVAVMRRDAARAKDYAQRHKVPRWYDDAEALVHDPEVDAVYIATPPHVHKEYTLMAAKAGKAVYVEKPMALTYADCQEMIAACDAHHVSLWVAYYRRMLPRFLKVKALLDDGAIGAVRSVQTRYYRHPPPLDPDNLPWRYQPEISGGGIFVDFGPHLLDLLDYFIAPIREVSGFAVNQGGYYRAEDHVTASFCFENGVLGSGVWCFNSWEESDSTEIIGTQGKIVFAVSGDHPIHLFTDSGEQHFIIDHPPHVQQPLIQSIVDEMNGKSICPSSATSGARTTWVIDHILAAYRSKI